MGNTKSLEIKKTISDNFNQEENNIILSLIHSHEIVEIPEDISDAD